MGSKLSSLASPGRNAHSEPLVAPDGDDDDHRPAKRRKIRGTNNDNSAHPLGLESPRRMPFGHVTNESQRASTRLVEKSQGVQPSNFNGRSRPTTPGRLANLGPRRPSVRSRRSKTNIDSFLPAKPIDFKRAMRIKVSGIVAKSEYADRTVEFAKGRTGPIETKCRCSVALFGAKNDDDPSGPLRGQDYNEVHRTSKTGILRTTLHNGQVSRELFVEPFVLSSYEFYVNRRRPNKHGDCHFEFDFWDKYYVQVTLDPVGPQKEWPPFDISTLAEPDSMDEDDALEHTPVADLLRSGKVLKNELCLFCSMPGLLEPDRQVRSVDLKLAHGSIREKVPFGLDIQMQWSLPSQYCDAPANIPLVESPVKARAMLGETVPISPFRARPDQSPNPATGTERAARRRSNVPTYNLKALSAQAQGKSPRTRKNLRVKALQEHSDAGGAVMVTYSFGRAGALELGIKQQTSMAGFLCPFCYVDETSIDDLRLHLHTNHTNFKFSLRRSNPSRVGFFVELAKQSSRQSPGEKAKTFQLCKAQTLFDLEKFLGGDQSWVRVREGPHHNHWPEHLNDPSHESSSSSSPQDSRHSSPNTPNDTDELIDAELCPPKKRIPRKIFYVPKTSKALFDTVSKRVLEPGEEIPDSDDEKDETWLHQKHRDIINDFTDLTDEEKEYITRWNPFIVEEHLTSEKYLPDSCLRFTQANATWIVGKTSRKVEFGKQMETFIMRGVVEQHCLDKCTDILKAAERRKEASKDDFDMKSAEDRPVSPAKARGLLDCSCCEHTQPPDQVVCRGRVSVSTTPGGLH